MFKELENRSVVVYTAGKEGTSRQIELIFLGLLIQPYEESKFGTLSPPNIRLSQNASESFCGETRLILKSQNTTFHFYEGTSIIREYSPDILKEYLKKIGCTEQDLLTIIPHIDPVYSGSGKCMTIGKQIEDSKVDQMTLLSYRS